MCIKLKFSVAIWSLFESDVFIVKLITMANLKPLPIVDILDWKYIKKKRRKIDLNSSEEEIEQRNPFQPLAEDNDNQMEYSEYVQEVKKVKVPPVVIYSNLQNHNEALKALRKELSEDISLNCKRNRIIIYTKNLEDYKIVREKMSAAEVPYHTYTPQSEKPVFSILKGLASNVSTLEVKTDLLEKKLKVIEVKQFVKKVTDEDGNISSRNLPIFSVQFEKETSREEIRKVKFVCFCKVTWEPPRSKAEIVQCYKCQQFGHIAKNCFKKEICAICAKEHNTTACVNPSKIKCTNCGESHRADDRACEFHKRASKKKSSINRNQFRHTYTQPERRMSTTNVTQQEEGPTYSQAAKGICSNNNNRRDYQNQNNKSEEKKNEEESFTSVWNEIKNIFKGMNFKKVIGVVRNTAKKIRECNDGMSKFSCLIEGIIELFD